MKRTLIVIALIAALIAPIWAQNEGTTPDGFGWYMVDSNGIGIYEYKGTAKVVRIPDRINNLPVVRIDHDAFNPGNGNTSGITSVVIPSTVTSIGTSAFSRQSSLTTINFPVGLIAIESQAFNQCTALTSITLPASITTIGARAFYNCTALTTVTISASVTRIIFGAEAFRGVTNLNAVSVATLQRVGYVF